MENNQRNLKSGEKRMWRCGIFSVSLSCFILMSLLTLNFGMVPVTVEKGGGFGIQYKSSKLDSKPFKFIYTISRSAKKSDPIPDPSIKDVFMLLKNIQVELSALKNKTMELKSQLADLHVKILDQGNETREDQRQIKEKIKTNHDEVKKEFSNLSSDLKGQMTSLFNQGQNQSQQQEEPKSQPTEEKKEIPKQTTIGQNKEIVFIGNHPVQIHFQAPAPVAVPALSSSDLTTPQFFYFGEFQGSSYTPQSDEWKTKCVDLPDMDFLSSSVKTGGHCLLICPEKNCQSKMFGLIKVTCQRINTHTKEVSDFREVGKNTIKSFRRC